MAASVKISQLASVTAASNDDVFVINDANTNTRKITYENLTRNLITTTGDQEIIGDLTIIGGISANELSIDSPLFTIDTDLNAIGINTNEPRETLDVNGNVRIRDGFEIQFGDADDTHHISLKAPSVLNADTEYLLPTDYPLFPNGVLTSSMSGVMSWTTAMSDPTTTIGDMVIRNLNNDVDRLAIGTSGQILTVRGDGTPGWIDASPSFPDPMTSVGDMIYRNGSNLTTRIPAGTLGQTLVIGGGGVPVWSDTTASAAGSNAEIQFNTGNQFDAVPEFTYDTAGQILQVPNVSADSLDAATTLNVDGATTLRGTATVSATFTALGNAVLGSGVSNTLSINSLISGPLLPEGGNNIGADSRRWGDLFLGNSISMSDGSTEGLIEYESLTGYQFYGQGTGANPAQVVLYAEESSNGVTLASPIESAYTGGSYTITLPPNVGVKGQALVNDGDGELIWSNDTGGTLQTVTDNGNVTTNGIVVDAFRNREVTYPNVDGNVDEYLATDGAGTVEFRDTINGGNF